MNFLEFYFLNLFLFLTGIIGILINRKNVILIVVCIELALLSVNSILLLTSVYLDDLVGQILALFILIIAASESSLGLSILISFYRIYGSTSSASFAKLLNG